MLNKISPFTKTPGIAGKALIETHFSDEIITNFESSESYKYVYKIVGLRGSGKSVEYSLVMNHFRKQPGWLVYALSAGGDPLKTAIAMMSKEDFIDDKLRSETQSAEASVSGGISFISGAAKTGSSIQVSHNEHYYSDEVTFKEMLAAAKKHGYHVLIGIDDIAKSRSMVDFLSVLGSALLEADKDIHFICTGISKNIEDFVSVPHLSFFVRSDSIVMTPLDLHSIAQKYRTLLGASKEEAINLARFTDGYAYAYQVLGEICFKHDKTVIDEELEDAFDDTMGPQYDLIWSTLTNAEKDLVMIIVNEASGSVADIKAKMHNPSSFASLRDRLIKKHLLTSHERGSLHIVLPRFKEYVDLWQ